MIATATLKPRSAPTDDVIDGLRKLDASIRSASNRNERAIVLISACLGHGINSLPELQSTLEPLGFDSYHLEKIAKKHAGQRGTRAYWRMNGEGLYLLNP